MECRPVRIVPTGPVVQIMHLRQQHAPFDRREDINMSPKRTIGAILIVIGLVALAWGGVFWTQNKKVVDLGALEVHTQERKGVALPPALGFAALVGGIVLVAIPDRRRA